MRVRLTIIGIMILLALISSSAFSLRYLHSSARDRIKNHMENVKKKANYSYSEPIDVSNDILNKFVGKHREALIRHLAASADWRLTKDFGVLIAVCRQKRVNIVQVPAVDFLSGSEGDTYFQARIVILFAPRVPPYVYWGGGGGNSTSASAGGDPIRLKVKHPLPNSGQPGYSSCLNCRHWQI